MKKTLCTLLCICALLMFASCHNGEGDITTTAATEQTSQTQSESTSKKDETTTKADTSETTGTTAYSTTAPSTTKKKEPASTPSTKANEVIEITVNQALDRLSEFYGSAYDVNATVKENSIQYFKITDKKGNLYARVEVNLKTSDAKETIEHSGEVNEFNLAV